MSEMHDRGIRGAESGAQLEDASRQPDHLSMIFTADLERRPGFKRTAVTTRENRALELGRGGAEPAPGS
jgi:hypothetical protein